MWAMLKLLLNKSTNSINTGTILKHGENGPSTSSTTPERQLTGTSVGIWSRRTRELLTSIRKRKGRESSLSLNLPINWIPESEWKKKKMRLRSKKKNKRSKTEKIKSERKLKTSSKSRKRLNSKRLTRRLRKIDCSRRREAT